MFSTDYNMGIKIILADDHAIIREGLKSLLDLDDQFEVIAFAKDGLECIKVVKEVDADILLLDINMPNMNGLEVLQLLKENKKKIKVIVLTIHNEVEYLIKAIDIGINGYILKDSGYDELKEAITAVYNGETYIQPELSPMLNSKLLNRNIDKGKMGELTKREYDVLKLLAKGMYNKEIGETLDISERTVKNHVSSIFKKINVSDRTQAALFAIKNNIVEIN